MAQREISSGIGRPQVVQLEASSGAWLWILHRLAAWGLLLFLAIHLAFNHFVLPYQTQPISGETTSQSFQIYSFLYALNGSLLLLCALFHGLNGVRSIVFDYTAAAGVRRFTTAALVLLGLVLFILGTATLWALAGMTV